MSTIAELRRILKECHTIAVVGLSADWFRPSYFAAKYMQEHGYRIIPVNPAETEVLGEKAYATLGEVPFPVDIVNVFRQPEFVPEIVDEALRLGVKYLWLQEDVVHEAAAAKARAAGVKVVMDRCILKEHRRLML